jgi:hypothetical protein
VLFADGALGLLLIGLWVFCIFDVITTPAERMRHLPKAAWLLIVLLLGDIGSIVWLVVGRERSTRSTGSPSATGSRYPGYDRPGRAVPASPDDDEEFLRQLRERADAQRRRHEAQRRAERQAEQDEILRRPDES